MIDETRCQTAVHAVAATLLLVVFTSESYALEIYEFHSVDRGEALARMEVTMLPVESLEAINRIYLLDPLDPDYVGELLLSGALMDGVITATDPIGLGGSVGIEPTQLSGNSVPPSWNESNIYGFEFKNGDGSDELSVPDTNPLIFGDWRLVPEPGDFDGDGTLDAQDIDLLSAEIRGGRGDIDYDLNDDMAVDGLDREVWVHDLKGTYFGDANLNGLFDSADLVNVFVSGEYEDDIPLNSTWVTGDWNGDAEFDSGDLVSAFQDGAYVQGEVASIPEPTSFVSLLAGLIGLAIASNSRPMRV